MQFKVEQEIFDTLPGLKILFIIVKDIDLKSIDEEQCKEMLHEAWKEVPSKLADYENVQSHPRIKLWRNAYEKLKISTKKFGTSIENLIKRASKPGSRIPEINTIVDFYNAISIKFVVPFGGFDLSSPVCEDMQLRFSVPGDKFLALDSEEEVDVPVHEASYVFKNRVITRHINWKQSKDGLITENTTDVVFMAEILDENILPELIKFVQEKCEAILKRRGEVAIVDPSNPSLNFK